ncbi:MAG: hypothetical protein ABEH65_13020 [Halobacteriales archaeon]
MRTVDILYLITSVFLVLGLGILIRHAVQTYREATDEVFLHLAIGFTLIVGATLATSISALVTDFATPRLLLLSQNTIATIGYLFIVVSLGMHHRSQRKNRPSQGGTRS